MGQVSAQNHPASWSGFRKAYAVAFDQGHASIWRAEKTASRISTQPVYEGPADMEVEGWRRALRDMQAEQVAGLALVTAVLPSTQGFIVPLTTPLVSRAKALKVMPGLLDLELPFPVEQCRFALLDVHTTGAGGIQALATGARDRDIAEERDFWSRVKVEPSMLDQEGLVLWDQWRRDQIGQQDNRYQALLHFHPERSTLVLGSAEHIQVVRNLHQGADTPLERFKPALLRMIRGQEEVSIPNEVWVSGRIGEARMAELRELLLAEGWPALKPVPEGESLLERGTAIRALQPSSSSINLLLAEEQPDSLQQHRQRRTRHAGMLAALCGGLMILAAFALKQVSQQRLESIDQGILDKAVELTGYAPSSIIRHQEVLLVSRALEEKGQLDSPLLTALQPSLADTVQQVSEAAKQRGIQLQGLQVSHRGIRLSGKGATWSDAESFLKDLAALGRDLGLQRFSPSDTESTTFVITQRGAP